MNTWCLVVVVDLHDVAQRRDHLEDVPRVGVVVGHHLEADQSGVGCHPRQIGGCDFAGAAQRVGIPCGGQLLGKHFEVILGIRRRQTARDDACHSCAVTGGAVAVLQGGCGGLRPGSQRDGEVAVQVGDGRVMKRIAGGEMRMGRVDAGIDHGPGDSLPARGEGVGRRVGFDGSDGFVDLCAHAKVGPDPVDQPIRRP